MKVEKIRGRDFSTSSSRPAVGRRPSAAPQTGAVAMPAELVPDPLRMICHLGTARSEGTVFRRALPMFWNRRQLLCAGPHNVTERQTAS